MSHAKLQEAIEGERFRIEQSAERLRTLLDTIGDDDVMRNSCCGSH